MKKPVVGVLLACGALVLSSASASAEPPAGNRATCPPRYRSMTLAALLAQAERLAVPEANARALFSQINRNRDDWICQTKLPGDATSFNFIDNQAVGRTQW